jgi:hypothetical protein
VKPLVNSVIIRRSVQDVFGYCSDMANERVKSLFLCECLTREHRVQVVHAAAA